MECKDRTSLLFSTVTSDAISERCTVKTGNYPKRVKPLNELEAMLEFPNEIIVTQATMMLYKIKTWCGQYVKVNYTISPYGHLRKIIDSKVDSQADLNIEDRGIDTLSAGADDNYFKQITHQVSDKLVSYISEQVKCIESLGQNKTTPIPREESTTIPLVTNTQVLGA